MGDNNDPNFSRLPPNEQTVIQLFFLWLIVWFILLLAVFFIPFDTMPPVGHALVAGIWTVAIIFAFWKMFKFNQLMKPMVKRRLEAIRKEKRGE